MLIQHFLDIQTNLLGVVEEWEKVPADTSNLKKFNLKEAVHRLREVNRFLGSLFLDAIN